jgi:4-hydroxy-2-oxoheptanedioate aldolase
VRDNELRTRLERGERVTCGWLSSDSRYIAEVLSHAGYDAVTVDLQHGMFGLDGAVQLLQAVGAGPAMPMARCHTLDRAVIGKLLDGGAYGIICPEIDSIEECEALVAACRYPPVGVRSFGPARGLLYGGPDYAARANETILVWAMIESAAALEALDGILGVDGLDGVYIGPNDLALSLGEAGGAAESSPHTRAAIERIVTVSKAAGRFVGGFAPAVATAHWMIELGVDLVTPGNDVQLLKQAVRQRLQEVDVPTPSSP